MELLSYAFDSTCSFNFRKCVFRFEKREFAIVPGDEYTCDVVHTIIQDSNERDVVFRLLHKFFYHFGWANRCSFHFKQYIAQGISQPLELDNIKSKLIVNRKYRNLIVGFEHLLPPVSSELDLALSLFNDAKYTDNSFYRFLCFWKILDINSPGKKKLPASKWIDDKFADGTVSFPDYLHDFVPRGKNLGEFLKDECRNAISHITRKPTVISFRAADLEKIGKACEVIEPFVEYFIRNVLNTPKQYDTVEVLTIERKQQQTVTWINHELFTQKWLERSQRGEDAKIDDGDRFISLWIAFNGWMRGKYGENSTDRYLIDCVKSLNEMKNIYSYLQIDNKSFYDNLEKIKSYTVVNMSFVDDENRTKKYDGTFESLIDVIYQIRCNLFHGRKEINDDKKDFELVCLAYAILLPLFKAYLDKYGYE